jgi:hypothetical protein
MKSTSTLLGRATRAIQYAKEFYQGSNRYWVGLGRTSPWPQENDPPYPAASATYIHELVGFWPVSRCELVFPHSQGSIDTAVGKFTAVANWNTASAGQIAAAKATNVFLETEISPDSFSSEFKYRLIGLCQYIVPTSGVELSESLGYLPAELVDSYLLDWVSTLEPVTVTKNTTHVIQIIREF